MLTDQDIEKMNQVFTTKDDLQRAINQIIQYVSESFDTRLSDHENRITSLEKRHSTV